MAILLKVIYRFNAITIKLPLILSQNYKNLPYFIYNQKRACIAKIFLSKTTKLEASHYWLQIILQGYSNENSIVLVPKQYRPLNRTEASEIICHTPTTIWFLTNQIKTSHGERIPYLIVLGKLVSHMQKIKTGLLSYTLYKN